MGFGAEAKPRYTPAIVKSFFVSLLLVAVVVPLWVDASDPTAAEQAIDPSPGCVHEMIYDPFANLILVNMSVGDSLPLTFILDTGATQSALTDPLLAAFLGIKIREAGLARGMGAGATWVRITEEVSLRNAGWPILETALVVHDIGSQLAAQAGRPIDGFIGWELFDRYVVELDPVGRRLLLHDPVTFVYEGDGEVLPMEVVGRRPLVTASVVVKKGEKPVPVNLIVDTGSNRSLSLISRSRRRLKPPAHLKQDKSIGVTGDISVVVGRTARLEMGPLDSTDVETTWVEPYRIPAARNIDDLNGVLGNPLLNDYHVFFDYRGGRFILEPL
mgnify:FL=1